MTRRPVDLAFLGCGFATRTHAETLGRRRFRDRVRLHYASRDPARAREMARKGRAGSRAYGSYGEALSDPGVDAVLVATPPVSHLEWTLAGLRAGKHVVVEKPPFLRSADFDRVASLSREADRTVLVAENYHYKPLAVTLRKLLAERVVGDILFVAVNAAKEQEVAGWRGDPELAGGGALFEGGIHWIDFMAHLGPEVVEVRGHRAGGGRAPVGDRAVEAGRAPDGDPAAGEGLPERSMLVSFRYDDGSVGTLLHSWEVPSPLRGLRTSRIHGREGSITFESNGLFVLVWGRRKRWIFPGFRDISGYRAMFDDFLDVLESGSEPRFTLAAARRELELVEEAYRTAGIPLPDAGGGEGGEDAGASGNAGEGRGAGTREADAPEGRG